MLSDFFHDPRVDTWIVTDDIVKIRLKTKASICSQVELLYGDPFDWHRTSNHEMVWSGEQNPCSPLSLIANTQTFDYYEITVPLPTKRAKYAFFIDGRYVVGSLAFIDTWATPDKKYFLGHYFNIPYLLPQNDFLAPEWMKKTIWYSIFPDRFCNVDNRFIGLCDWNQQEPRNDQFYGGNLKGITSKLDYLQGLGFNGIYLTPIFQSLSAHKYDTIDYFTIDPLFGSLEDLQELTRQAHFRGIRIVLDLVFNHVSIHHPFFQDVIQKGKNSPYYSAFYMKSETIDIRSLEHFKQTNPFEVNYHIPYETFAFSYRMPKVNCDHPLIQKTFQEVALYWLDQANVDGFRLDVANEISHDFWRNLRKRVKSHYPNACLIGESWDITTSFLQGDQWDSLMNYPLTTIITEFFHPQSKRKLIEFQDSITDLLHYYSEKQRAVLYNLIGSHDLARIFTLLEGHLPSVMQAFLMLYAFPGMPSVYYGDEVGLTGGKDPQNRRPMIWEEAKQHQELKQFFTTLNHLYSQLEAFQSLHLTFLSRQESLVVFQKKDVYFFLNRSSNPCTFKMDAFQGEVLNHWTNEILVCDGALQIPPYQFRIFSKTP